MDTKTNDPNHLINDSANEERILKRPRSVPREIKGLQDSYIYQYQNNRENPRPRTNFEIDERTPFNRLQEEEECPSFSPKSADKAEEEECLSISPQSADLHLSVSHDLSPVKHLSAAPSSSSELELLITDQEGKKGHSFDIEMKSLRPYLSFFKNKILPSKRPRITVSYYKETAAVGANKLTAAAVVTLELTLESQRAYFEASHPEKPPICLSGSVSFSSPSGSDGSA